MGDKTAEATSADACLFTQLPEGHRQPTATNGMGFSLYSYFNSCLSVVILF